ncbi:hypothetical protein DEFDS_P258 (plasmid) [Deferribacter desulfuricans SSM1]|uniref:Uncharacterized protein n=1 Tax=Deferribacter desulfuricans (strain DSM 14783 / JCM 11476 / NBRC 101012 / SSM1) TaxID=639282 RepID=D3PF86_DEFDS|nr:hypothetical protein [Deferribacter desulfuricans]BAI81878.1 hypothetical protein DEFDS_P258 [Deferribacter desulfuricans SSM1]
MKVSQIQEPIRKELDRHYLNLKLGKTIYNIVGKHGISKTATIFNDEMVKKSKLLSTMVLFYDLYDKEWIEDRNTKILFGEFKNSELPTKIKYSELKKYIPILEEFLNKTFPYSSQIPYVYNSAVFLYELLKNRVYTFAYIDVNNKDANKNGLKNINFYFNKKSTAKYMLNMDQDELILLTMNNVLSILDSLIKKISTLDYNNLNQSLQDFNFKSLNDSLEKTVYKKLSNKLFLDKYKSYVIRIFSVAGLRATDFGYQYIDEDSTVTSNSFNVPNIENVSNGIYPLFGFFVLDDGFINPEILTIYYGLFDEKNPTIAGKPIAKTIVPVVLSNEATDRVVSRTKMLMSGAHNTRVVTLHVEPDLAYNLEYLITKEINPLVEQIEELLEIKQIDINLKEQIKKQIDTFIKTIKASKTIKLYEKLLNNEEDEYTFDSFDLRVLKQLLVKNIFYGYLDHVLDSQSIKDFRDYVILTLKTLKSSADHNVESNPKLELLKYLEREVKTSMDASMVKNDLLIDINNLLSLDDESFVNKVNEIQKHLYSQKTGLINSLVVFFNSGNPVSTIESKRLYMLLSLLGSDELKNIQTRLNSEGKELYAYVFDTSQLDDGFKIGI